VTTVTTRSRNSMASASSSTLLAALERPSGMLNKLYIFPRVYLPSPPHSAHPSLPRRHTPHM
jgi:hypothetical protein